MATPTIRYNSKGAKVADLQKRLLALGFNPGPVDGIVHHVEHGVLYTIEGNRTPQVHGFDYVLSRMEKLLGYGHVPEKW